MPPISLSQDIGFNAIKRDNKHNEAFDIKLLNNNTIETGNSPDKFAQEITQYLTTSLRIKQIAKE